MCSKRRPIKTILIFSSAMAQYVSHVRRGRRVIDFVDIDSDKWKQYAATARWPMNWIYSRESRLLLDYERQVAQEFDSATFVSEAEASLFKQLAPEAASKVSYFNNGVDADYFSPRISTLIPIRPVYRPLVFIGAMDYWANVDAVEWFARSIFPRSILHLPRVSSILSAPVRTPAGRRLPLFPGVMVTGVRAGRPALSCPCCLAVAPLRIARGIQNKVLEAMAMEKIVIASPQAQRAYALSDGQELWWLTMRATFSNRSLNSCGPSRAEIVPSVMPPGLAFSRITAGKKIWGELTRFSLMPQVMFNPGSARHICSTTFNLGEMSHERMQTPREIPHDSSVTLDQQNVKGCGMLTLATIASMLVGYHETTWSMISIWERSDTFAHGFLIFPFSAYLIWGQRKCLSDTVTFSPILWRCWYLASWVSAGCWRHSASVQVLAAIFLIAMIPAAVWAILGEPDGWALAFPLAYLLLAVPFGEALIPPLIDFTADFTVKALQLTGIPVYREGSFFSIPSGNWSVVEACSGLRYLIASFTLGTLYAYLTYRSLARRLMPSSLFR